MLEVNDGVAMKRNRLKLWDTEAQARLDAAIGRICETTLSSKWRMGAEILAKRPSVGPALVAIVTPLAAENPIIGLSSPVRCAVMILEERLRTNGRLPARLRRLYGLTEAETEVAIDLATGRALAEIATVRSTSIDTVRSQVKAALEKTNARRQADLASLVNRSRSSGRPRATSFATPGYVSKPEVANSKRASPFEPESDSWRWNTNGHLGPISVVATIPYQWRESGTIPVAGRVVTPITGTRPGPHSREQARSAANASGRTRTAQESNDNGWSTGAMAKPRSQFTRLGAHVAKNSAHEVRVRAAAGDPIALTELRRLEAGLTLVGLQDKGDDILSQMLVRVTKTLQDLGHASPPLNAESSVAEHGRALLSWASEHRSDPDSLEGRMIEVLRLCAHALIESDSDKADFLLGLVLGYGIAQKYFLAFREYSDGPALAREAAMMKARSRGGEEKRKSLIVINKERDRAISDRFRARPNKRQSKKAWAEDNADRENMSARNLRRILASC